MINVNRKGVMLLSLLLFAGFLSSADSAQYFLFADESGNKSAAATLESVKPSHLKSIRRFRRVALTPMVKTSDSLIRGDVLALNLFEDTAYTARIDRIHTHVNGTVSIRARIDDYPMGYLLLSTTGDESLAVITIPEKALQYCIQNNPAAGEHYLYEIDAGQIEALEDSLPQASAEDATLTAKDAAALQEQAANGPMDTANIDVMVVYTPAAMNWAGGQSGIANVIAQAMERAQLVLDNSGTFLTVTLVHSAQVDYTESGDSKTDLNRLTYTTDGYMEEVHDWRYTYKADLVALLAVVNDTGGQAWPLYFSTGSPAYGFSLSRVQQTAWTYTLIHELGHNLGCHHRKDQEIQPGPGLFSYSAGWRWIGYDSSKYCSVMSYEEEDYSRVAYFSNPDIQYEGVATGDAADGDNARTIRETKHVVAAYREPTGSLKVSLGPQDAVAAGVQWRRLGTSVWYDSDSIEQYIPVGNDTVEFKNTSGWEKPDDVSVSVSENQLTETSAVYTLAPEVFIGQGVSSWEFPLAASYHDARMQTIYLADEIGGACNLIALGLYVTDIPGQALTDFTIRLKHTRLEAYSVSGGWESSNWTTVYQADEEITEAGWVMFYFETPFIYNGADNLMVDISFDNNFYRYDGMVRYSTPGQVRTLYYQTDSEYGRPLTWSDQTPTPLAGYNVPNIKLVTTALTGDLNNADGVDYGDLTLFVSHWHQSDCGEPNWCGGADLNKSGDVDLNDYEILARHWLDGSVQYPVYDIISDGQINADDLLVLIEQWLALPGTPSADIAPQPRDNFVDFEDFALLAAHWLESF